MAYALYTLSTLFRFKAVAAKSKLDLVNEGFTEFTIEDFHHTVSLRHHRFCLPDFLSHVSAVRLVHGPDRAVREAAQLEGAAQILQRPERVGLRGGVLAAAHLGLPAAGARFLPALHRGRTLGQGVLSAGTF